MDSSRAHGPTANSTAVAEIVAPKIEPVGKARNPIAAVAFSPDGRWIAAARYGCVEILSAPQRTSPGSGSSAFGKPVLLKTLSGIAGNVNGVGFSTDGTLLFAAAGEAGLFGELSLWNTADWSRRLTLRGHRDALLGAALSPDGKIAATASYDQTIRLWSVATGKELRVLKGHNGPVFDVAFDPTSRLLASASGDRTVKLWDVASGERLDTFSQPTKDQYAVAFSPDGQPRHRGRRRQSDSCLANQPHRQGGDQCIDRVALCARRADRTAGRLARRSLDRLLVGRPHDEDLGRGPLHTSRETGGSIGLDDGLGHRAG